MTEQVDCTQRLKPTLILPIDGAAECRAPSKQNQVSQFFCNKACADKEFLRPEAISRKNCPQK